MSSSALAAGIHHLRRKLAAQQHHEDSDEHLLHAFLSRRDDSAFAVLVRRHGPMVLHVCKRVLEHEQDAEDAFQATFLVLARKAASLRKKSSLAGFLHGIAYRTAMKVKQAAARRRKYEGSLGALTQPRSPIDPADELSWREVRALLDEEIARLPEKYRSVFILCGLEELSRAEAGQRLGLKERTVLSRLAEARKRLQRRLTWRGVELTAALACSTQATTPAPALSPLLISTTIKAALSESTALLLAAQASALVQAVESAAIFGKSKIGTAVLLAVSMVAGAVAWTASANRLRIDTEAPPAEARPQLEQAKNTAAPPQKKENVVRVKGRVLGPDGNPIQGARLYSARAKQWVFQEEGDAVAAFARKGSTDEQGRFQINVRKPDMDEPSFLIAHAAGFGVDWINLNFDDLASEVTLRLVKDVPITGRVVNTEGRPVAGVSVSLAQVWAPDKDNLDDYLHGYLVKFKEGWLYPTQKRLLVPLDAIGGAAKTDEDGRFTLRGAGSERIVHVAFSGGGVARSALFVITRPGFDAKPYNALRTTGYTRGFVDGRFLGPHPPQFSFVAEAGKAIEGIVTDADTGKPVAGCRVRTQTSYDHVITVESNSEGKYRLEGLAKRAHGFDMWVDPPEPSFYLGKSVYRVPDTVGFSTIRLDFALIKGALVTGHVVDKRTGKGVRCDIYSRPLAGNKFFASKLASDRRDHVSSRLIEAGEDGCFRLLSIPGPSLLGVSVRGSVMSHGNHMWGIYRDAVPDPDHKELFTKFGRTWRVETAGGGFLHLGNDDAVKVIDIKENGKTRVEISVDPGATADIVVQDAEGKPLPGTWAAGLTARRSEDPRRLPEATATVYAMNPEHPREMAFLHVEKKLGGTATVRGDEKGPVVVKLAPLGKVSGRLLDDEGNPLKGVEVWIMGTDIGRNLYLTAAPPGQPVYTDNNGRFHIEGVVPYLNFWVRLRNNDGFLLNYDTEPSLFDKQIQPGETLDFGDVRLKKQFED